MVPRDRGHVVQVGSSLAYRGIPLQSAYCGAKHAMVGFTESVQAELDHEGSAVHLSMVHMPALNTPQFGWVRSRLPKHPQPVPPIFQPEVGAQAVAYVVEHPRRRTAVSWRTAAITIGNAILPRALDWYIGKTGVSGQQTEEELPVYGDNLEHTVGRDVGAHGSFGHRAKDSSPATWLNLRAGRALGAATSVATAAGGAVGGVVGPAVGQAASAVRTAASRVRPGQEGQEGQEGAAAPDGMPRDGVAQDGADLPGAPAEEVARWR
jgi:hypothetical protein